MPEMTTLAMPGLGVAHMPLMKMPLDLPLALMEGLANGEAATSERDLVMVTCSAYEPAATSMTSPADAAATAALMVDLQPALPLGLTQRVAAVARQEASENSASAEAPRETKR